MPSSLQDTIAGLWSDALGVAHVGVHDDFFDLGGDSIRAAVFLNRLQQLLGEPVSAATIFERPTIAGLVEHLEAQYPDAAARLRAGPSPHGAGGPDPLARAGAVFDPVAQRRGGQQEPQNPSAIFILAPPRSGSTLLRVMLCGHPSLFAPPELELLSHETLAAKQAALGERYGFWTEGIRRAIMALEACDAEQAQRTLDRWHGAQVTTAQCYLELQTLLGPRTLVDKTPSYAFDLDTLRRAEAIFEQPRYIHLVRHPQAAIRSFEEADLDRLLLGPQSPSSLRDVAESVWLVSHQNILAFLDGVPEDRHHRLHFERLVTEPRAATEAVCRFLGLELHPDMLDPYADPGARMTDGLPVDPAMVRGSSEPPEPTMLGDPKFLRRGGIDAAAASGWRADDGARSLGEVTWRLAEFLGYDRPLQTAARGSWATLRADDLDEGAI